MKRSLLFFVVTLCVAGLVQADQTIRSLQQTLKDQGFYYGTVTGEKSGETTAAIRRYQIRNGLQVTGEMNEETLRSLNSKANSTAATRPSLKPSGTQLGSVRPEATPPLNRTSPPASFSEPDRSLESNPSYAAGFYQSAPVRLSRRVIAGAQYALMSRGYYRGRVDGNYGPQTAFAVRAFQSSAGLPSTGRLDMQTLNALGSADTDFAYAALSSRMNETWIPVTKFKHGTWKVKWKKYYRGLGNDGGDEDREANSEYDWQDRY
jgi:peptidoglycan hydrolase-like protein with peptidoglycan-binding domain